VFWIFAAVLLCQLVLVPQFRKVAAYIVGGLIVAYVIAWIYFDSEDSVARKAKDADFAALVTPPPVPKLIPSNEIRFGDLTIQTNSYSRQQITGIELRIYNDSPTDTLESIKYRLKVEDCRGGDKATDTCATIHEQQSVLNYLDIPPKQARDESIKVPTEGYGVNPTVKGKPKIDLEFIEAHANASK
jgi:hypothetical protein